MIQTIIQTIIYILIAVFIVQQSTPINITSASIFKKSELNTYPYLKDGVISDKYTVKRIPGKHYPTITYNVAHNFFLVQGGGGGEDLYLKKLDGNGNEIITIKKEEFEGYGTPSFRHYAELAYFTHYLFNKNGVYDLSEKDIKEVLFKEVINQDRSLEPKAWIKLFDEYYKEAQVVVYGEELPRNKDYGFPIYFRIGKEWIKLFTKKGEVRANGINALKLEYKEYPAKFTRTIILKDPVQKVFSESRMHEHYVELHEDKDDSIKNYGFKYSNTSKIKSIFFEKKSVYETLFGGYTSIPIAYTGTSYYQLKIKDNLLKFKESAIKPIFRRLQNHLHWYILPDAYFQNADVSFLEVAYPSNHNDSGSKGTYIIKKKNDR